MRKPDDCAAALAPRRSLWFALAAAVVTLGFFVLLPYLERWTAPPRETTRVRSVSTVHLPPPPEPPSPPAPPPPAEDEPRRPRPAREDLRRLVPLRAAMDMNFALGDAGGDFDLAVGMEAGTLMEQVSALVFDPGDLDAPPRPLARLAPVYPPQARMRRIEGEVTVEFVVGDDGVPRNIEIVSSRPGDVFEEAARNAVQRWRFTPGRRDGRPVATRVRQRITFRLD